MTLEQLADDHLRKLAAAIEQIGQQMAAHEAKSQELQRHLDELAVEQQKWLSALTGDDGAPA